MRCSRSRRILTAVMSTLLAGVATVVNVVTEAGPAAAAVSPSQQFLTNASGSITAPAQVMNLTFGTSGVTGTYTGTAGAGTAIPQNVPLPGLNVTTYLEPDPPPGSAHVDQNVLAPNGSFSGTVLLNKPVSNPILHVTNLDGGTLTVGGVSTTNAPITLAALVKNNALEISGNVLNSITSTPNNVGCENDVGGTNPSGACGSIRLTAASGLIQSFSLTYQYAHQGGSGDGSKWTLSFPTAALTAAFSPADINSGDTSQLTFTITNPSDPGTATLTGQEFDATLPTAVFGANGVIADNGNCGPYVPTNGGGFAWANGSAHFEASNLTIAPGTTCTITVTVNVFTTGSHPMAPGNVTTGDATHGGNLVSNANANVNVRTVACPVSKVYYAVNSPTQFQTGTFGPGSVSFANTGSPTNTYNAIAWNPADGYVYAIEGTTNNVLQIDPGTGAVTNLGATSPALTGSFNVGAFDASGNFDVMGSSTSTLQRIAIPGLGRTPLALLAVPNAADLTPGPGNFLWGGTGPASPGDRIVRVDPVTGTVTFFAVPAALVGATGYGGAFTYGNGDVGLAQNSPGRIDRISITNPASATPTIAYVSSQSAPPAPAGLDATSCLSTPPADLSIQKFGPQFPPPGVAMGWLINVTNNGPGTSSGFTVTDVVPAGFTGVNSPTPGCAVVFNSVTCTEGTLAPAGVFQIAVNATAPAKKVCLTNTATLTPNDAEPPGVLALANNTSSFVTCTKAVSKAAVEVQSTNWSLGDALPGTSTIDFTYGARPLTGLMGDWDGNGTITVGTFELGYFKLKNSNDGNPLGAGDVPAFQFGDPRGFPIAGDFDGNGYDDVAVFRCGTWQVHYLGPGAQADATFSLGAPFATDCTWPATMVVAGDWDGDGIDGIGTYKFSTGQWVLKNTVGAGAPDIGPFTFWGGAGSNSTAVVGNWTGSGIDFPGYRVGSTWTYRTASITGGATGSFNFGAPNSMPFLW